MAKIVIPGGSGQIGGLLARHWGEQHEVVILSRGGGRTGRPPRGVRSVAWDGATPGAWTAEVDGADVVVNLAGRSVDCRYTRRSRQEILDSRLRSTLAVGRAIAAARRPPPVWLQAATATIYDHRFDAPQDDVDGTIGAGHAPAPQSWRFSVDVATQWENAAVRACPDGTRLVLLRSAMTMSPDRGGVFDVLSRLVRRGVGGPAASGRQFVSWIHGADFARALDFLIATDQLSGPINVAAPHPLPNADFMRALRAAWGVRGYLPSPRWLLELGALLLRTETELVLKSRRVVPRRLLEAGFEFRFPEWGPAVRDLVDQGVSTISRPR